MNKKTEESLIMGFVLGGSFMVCGLIVPIVLIAFPLWVYIGLDIFVSLLLAKVWSKYHGNL